MDEKITICYRQPTAEEYACFREIAGWGVPDKTMIERSLNNALFSVCLEKERKLIGMARIVGDNGLYFYIQDVIVLPEFRGLGYAKIMMAELFKFLKKNACNGAFIGLFATKQAESLYSRLGFVRRPNQQFGAGMFLPVEKIP